MEIIKTYERTQSMDAETYFNSVYNATNQKLLQTIIIKTSNADDVEDIFQNVYQEFYLRILKKGYADIQFPLAFLKKITEKQLAQHYKRKAFKRDKETDIEGCEELLPMDNVDFDELIDMQDVIESARLVVKTMPLMSYKCFTLFYFYDMPICEIAAALKLSEDGVKSRLWRARNVVKQAIRGVLYE